MRHGFDTRRWSFISRRSRSPPWIGCLRPPAPCRPPVHRGMDRLDVRRKSSVPFFIFAPRAGAARQGAPPPSSCCSELGYRLLTGNYTFFNLLTIALWSCSSTTTPGPPGLRRKLSPDAASDPAPATTPEARARRPQRAWAAPGNRGRDGLHLPGASRLLPVSGAPLGVHLQLPAPESSRCGARTAPFYARRQLRALRGG